MNEVWVQRLAVAIVGALVVFLVVLMLLDSPSQPAKHPSHIVCATTCREEPLP